MTQPRGSLALLAAIHALTIEEGRYWGLLAVSLPQSLAGAAYWDDGRSPIFNPWPWHWAKQAHWEAT